MATQSMKRFLSADKFAVVGRVLTDKSRWDNKILNWYIQRGFNVRAFKPDAKAGDEAEGIPIKPLSELSSLPDLKDTCISVIINPVIGINLLKKLYPIPSSASGNETRGIWFQPGAESDEIRSYVKERDLGGKVVLGGPCVWRDGDGILAEIASKVGGQAGSSAKY